MPQAGFDDTFDLGAPTLRWRDLWLSRNVNVSGTATVKSIVSYDWGNVTISESQITNLAAYITSTNVAFKNNTNLFSVNQNFSNNITFTTASARLCNATGSCYTLDDLNTTTSSSSGIDGTNVAWTNQSNNRINITNGLVLNPNSSVPYSPVKGLLFYNLTSNTPTYYNGSDWYIIDAIPLGTISAFNSACPTGWSEFTNARGRYIDPSK